MAEPLYEQVSEALRLRMEDTIVSDGGTTYWYTPSKVVRSMFVQASWLDDSIEDAHLIFLTPDQYTFEEWTTGTWKGRAQFKVWLAIKDSRVEMNPLLEDTNARPLAVTVLSRSIEDIVTALRSEVTLGALAINVADGDITAEFADDAPNGWLMASLSFTVLYEIH